MTPRQKQLLEYVRTYIEQHSISPTFADMQTHMGLASKSGIARLVDGLVAEGHLARTAASIRNLELAIPKGRSFPSLVSIPTGLLKAELDRRERES